MMDQFEKGKIMDKTSLEYINEELIRVCPSLVNQQEFFKIQIRSADGRATKWLKITPAQFRSLERILLGME